MCFIRRTFCWGNDNTRWYICCHHFGPTFIIIVVKQAPSVTKTRYGIYLLTLSTRNLAHDLRALWTCTWTCEDSGPHFTHELEESAFRDPIRTNILFYVDDSLCCSLPSLDFQFRLDRQSRLRLCCFHWRRPSLPTDALPKQCIKMGNSRC